MINASREHRDEHLSLLLDQFSLARCVSRTRKEKRTSACDAFDASCTHKERVASNAASSVHHLRICVCCLNVPQAMGKEIGSSDRSLARVMTFLRARFAGCEKKIFFVLRAPLKLSKTIYANLLFFSNSAK